MSPTPNDRFEDEDPRRPGPPPDDTEDDGDEDSPRRRRGEPPRNGLAVTSLVLGLLSLCFPVLINLAAVVLGIVALVQIGKTGARGRGQAIAGIVTGVFSLVLLPPLLIALLLPAVQSVRDAAARMQSANNLKLIGLAMHRFHDKRKEFPPAAVYAPDGRPLLSWRVALLPYLEEEGLYLQFKRDEPWDSPHNLQFVNRMPAVYAATAARPEDTARGLTHYQAFVGSGPGGPRPVFVLTPGVKTRMADVSDGTSNTLLAVEAKNPVPWTRPEDLPYEPQGPLPEVGGVQTRGFNALFADGSVRFFQAGRVDEPSLRGAVTMNGNEPVQLP